MITGRQGWCLLHQGDVGQALKWCPLQEVLCWSYWWVYFRVRPVLSNYKRNTEARVDHVSVKYIPTGPNLLYSFHSSSPIWNGIRAYWEELSETEGDGNDRFKWPFLTYSQTLRADGECTLAALAHTREGLLVSTFAPLLDNWNSYPA